MDTQKQELDAKDPRIRRYAFRVQRTLEYAGTLPQTHQKTLGAVQSEYMQPAQLRSPSHGLLGRLASALAKVFG